MDTKIKTVQQSKISYEKNTVPIAVPHMLNAMGSSNRNDNGGIVISADVRFSGKMSRTSMNANLSGSNDGLSKDTHCVNLPLRANTVFPRSDVLSDIGWNRLQRRTNHLWTARVLLSMERSSSGRKGIIVVMDAERHTLLYGAYNVSEKPRDLHTFFRTLAQRGLSLKYATIDGNPALSIALQQQWPEVILQRCLVHIQRQGLSWCRRNPKRTDAKHLRELFLAVTSVDTVAKRDMFVDHVITWEQRYGARIAGTPDHGYVFSDLKRARSMLLAALPNMFHYLFHPSIARSTNALEGYFARLKQRYRQHRGLAQRHRYAYFQWYLALCKR